MCSLAYTCSTALDTRTCTALLPRRATVAVTVEQLLHGCVRTQVCARTGTCTCSCPWDEAHRTWFVVHGNGTYRFCRANPSGRAFTDTPCSTGATCPQNLECQTHYEAGLSGFGFTSTEPGGGQGFHILVSHHQKSPT